MVFRKRVLRVFQLEHPKHSVFRYSISVLDPLVRDRLQKWAETSRYGHDLFQACSENSQVNGFVRYDVFRVPKRERVERKSLGIPVRRVDIEVEVEFRSRAQLENFLASPGFQEAKTQICAIVGIQNFAHCTLERSYGIAVFNRKRGILRNIWVFYSFLARKLSGL